MNISIIGLGKLGSCMAAVYADKGHHVVGYDLNENHVAAIQHGIAPVSETDLQTYISKNSDRLQATSSLQEAVLHTSISFIIVPTPSESDGSFSTEFVAEACRQIGAVLKEKTDQHLVVLTSTLLPGDCDEKLIPLLESSSQKKCGVDFGFCYSPLFIAIGSVIQNLRFPDFFLIGEHDSSCGDILENFYQTISENKAPIKRMNISSAELTKISVNSFITMKITFANMLGEVAEHIPGVNIDDVTDAIGSDHRIGKAYLKSGLGFGGPCFPRDNRAIARMAERRGVEIPFAERTDRCNQSIICRMVEKIKKHTLSKNDIIAVIGLSYKPKTAFCEESQGLAIAQALSQEGFCLHLLNEDGNTDAKTRINETEKMMFYNDLHTCIQGACVIFFALPIQDLDQSIQILKNRSESTIIDPWRQLITHHTNGKLGTTNYVPCGKHL